MESVETWFPDQIQQYSPCPITAAGQFGRSCISSKCPEIANNELAIHGVGCQSVRGEEMVGAGPRIISPREPRRCERGWAGFLLREPTLPPCVGSFNDPHTWKRRLFTPGFFQSLQSPPLFNSSCLGI